MITLLLSASVALGEPSAPSRCFPLSYTMGNGTGFLLRRGTLGGVALYLEEHSWCADGSDGVAVLPVPSWEGGIDGVRAILRVYDEAYPDHPTYIATPVEGGILVAPTRGPRTVDRPVTLPDAGTVRDGERSIVEQIGIRPGDAPSVAHGCAREPAVGRRSGTLLQVLRELNGPCRLAGNPNPVGFYIQVDPVWNTIDYNWMIDEYNAPDPDRRVMGPDGVVRINMLDDDLPLPDPNDPMMLEFLMQLEREEKEKSAAEPPKP